MATRKTRRVYRITNKYTLDKLNEIAAAEKAEHSRFWNIWTRMRLEGAQVYNSLSWDDKHWYSNYEKNLDLSESTKKKLHQRGKRLIKIRKAKINDI